MEANNRHLQEELLRALKAQEALLKKKGQAPTQGPVEPSGLEYAKELARTTAQGVTFGFADELEAAARAPFSDRGYNDIRDEVRQETANFRQTNPVAAYGSEIASSLLVPGGTIKAGKQVVGRLTGQGALYGAGASENSPINAPGGFAADVAAGGTLAAGIGAAGQQLPKVTPAARRMIERGVPLTPGQSFGGAIKRFEEAATSTPIIGDKIMDAMERARGQFNIEALNEALAPIGRKLSKTTEAGPAAYNKTKSYIDSAYARVFPELTLPSSRGLKASAQRLLDDMLPDEASLFGQKADKYLERLAISAGDGRALKKVDADLGAEATRLLRSDSSGQREVGYALFQMKTALRQELVSQNPNAGPALKAADDAFSAFIVAEDAVIRATIQNGKFTPGQLAMSARKTDKGRRKSSTAQGKRPLQKLAADAEKTIGSRTPDSGTARRVLTPALAVAAVSNPSLLALPAVMAPAYSKRGIPLTRGAVNALRPSVQAAAPVSGSEAPTILDYLMGRK